METAVCVRGNVNPVILTVNYIHAQIPIVVQSHILQNNHPSQLYNPHTETHGDPSLIIINPVSTKLLLFLEVKRKQFKMLYSDCGCGVLVDGGVTARRQFSLGNYYRGCFSSLLYNDIYINQSWLGGYLPRRIQSLIQNCLWDGIFLHAKPRSHFIFFKIINAVIWKVTVNISVQELSAAHK